MSKLITINGMFSYREDNDPPMVARTINQSATVEYGDYNQGKFTVAEGSWQELSCSLTDVRYMLFENLETGSVNISTANDGSEIIARLYNQGDLSLVSWSGSVNLWFQAYNNSSSIYYTIHNN